VWSDHMQTSSEPTHNVDPRSSCLRIFQCRCLCPIGSESPLVTVNMTESPVPVSSAPRVAIWDFSALRPSDDTRSVSDHAKSHWIRARVRRSMTAAYSNASGTWYVGRSTETNGCSRRFFRNHFLTGDGVRDRPTMKRSWTRRRVEENLGTTTPRQCTRRGLNHHAPPSDDAPRIRGTGRTLCHCVLARSTYSDGRRRHRELVPPDTSGGSDCSRVHHRDSFTERYRRSFAGLSAPSTETKIADVYLGELQGVRDLYRKGRSAMRFRLVRSTSRLAGLHL